MTDAPVTIPADLGLEPVQVAGHWRNNAELIADVARLHFPDYGQDTLDMTYGKGNFWTKYRPARLTANDLDPATSADYNHDYRNLPVEWGGRFDVTVFDPPYVVRGGRKTDSTFRGMNEAYGLVDAPKRPADLLARNVAGLAEARRVTRPGGLVLLKYSNAVSGGRVQWGVHDMRAAAVGLGLDPHDEFTFYTSKARKQPERNGDGSPRRQRHARNNTSTLFVFRR